MKKTFSKGVFLSALVATQIYAADVNKKVVFASFKDEVKAEKEYNKYSQEFADKLDALQKNYPFDFVVRPSGKHYIITAEPFEDITVAKKVLREFRNKFPTAFINNTDTLKKDISSETESVSLVETVVKPKEQMVVKEEVSKEEVIESKNYPEYSLVEMIKEIVFTDPEIKERLEQFNAIMEEVGVADAGNYPVLDLYAKIGRMSVEKENVEKDTFTHSEITLRLVQNIFSGFETTHAVKRDEARARAAFNKYIEVAQDKMYRAIESYIKVLRYKEVLQIAKDNVKVHEETLLKIEDRYEKGFSTLSEVERVRGRLSLAKSNYVSETNNLIDAKINFHKALGRNINEKSLVLPEFKDKLPKTLEHAQDIAIHNNPSILVANEDIIVAQESLQYAKKDNYPSLDLELEATRYDNLKSSTDGREDDLSAMLVLNYNLYKGGADKAEKQRRVSLLNYEYTHKNTLKREVIESLGLSWSAYKMVQEQYKHQIQYRDLTQKTKVAYDEEFQLGRRTLIDLLDVQDEVNNIKINVIHSTYDLLFSKYRILDAMGELYKSFGYQFEADYKKDEIRAYVDQDKDGILDCEDQCDNSDSKETNLYGCQEINCIQVDEISFSKDISTQNELNSDEVQKIWGNN